ncbi:H(+)-transporting V0 sector ATPase subunit a [Tilletia horrida]|uniref:V-type proton ATPase subunit a n=1 Tax=Tilletia horrida TaxID=155126 RepID=A0AAN6JN09_9BASI|nr:H(+)-transporting V0 sector ATPase subunit a [Tilletia horrida]
MSHRNGRRGGSQQEQQDAVANESLFRSATMSLIQLYIPSEVCHATVYELGQLGNVQFKDLNPEVTPFQRTYVADVRRIDEMDRRLRFLYDNINKQSITVRPLESALPFVNSSFDQAGSGGNGSLNGSTGGGSSGSSPQMLDELSNRLRSYEERLFQMNSSYDSLQKRLQELEEAKHVLRETAVFFDQAEGRHETIRTSTADDDDNQPLLSGDVEGRNFASRNREPSQGNESGFAGFDLEFVAGTIDRTRMATFERILWRVLRGNLYMNYAEIAEPFEDPSREQPLRKNVFIIFAHGSELLAKIRKISESMGGTLYPIDSNPARREDALRDVSARIEDLNNVLYSTNATRRTELVRIAESISAWADVVRKEKLIYNAMNLFLYDARRKTLIAEGWCPTSDLPAIQLALRRAAENAGTAASVQPVLQELHTTAEPPTFHRTNKFTAAFQNIIDAYGYASYQEVNPGLFTVITFPFLFAVMFGDVGHGTLMFLAALVMVIFEKKLAKANVGASAGVGEIFDMFFYGRYIVLLMGAFSIFTGFLYNDIFSKSMHLFHPGWKWIPGDGELTAVKQATTYPFGLDPTWHGANNALVFTNSMKMKMSIILGVLHMSLAIFLQAPNFIHFGQEYSLWAELVPQITFFWSLFGYLTVAIIYKWATNWYETDSNGVVFRNNPPSLLNMLIYMFLSPGNVDKDKELYTGQAFVQTVLLLIAAVCVPWMLIAKPYILYKKNKARKGAGYRAVGGQEGEELPSHHGGGSGGTGLLDDDDDEAEGAAAGGGNGAASGQDGGHGGGGGGGHGHGEEFELGEVIIHQVIHTIEFCLGCISNTASYLRLWALSLAHAQLSEVLWTMTLANVFGMTGVTGVVATVFAFALFFVLSIAILVLMEGLSAFLHALRLHWVESGSKHYQAAGYKFTPLTFKDEDAE